jgi:hypothetical protein
MYQYKYGNNIIYFIGESRYDLTNYQLIFLPQYFSNYGVIKND